MGGSLGVLQDGKMHHVPGTSQLYDESSEQNVRRVPEPSNDPNDPLNWSLARRDRILAILSFTAVIATTLSPILAANTLTLSLYFGRNFTAVALLTGYHLAGVAVAGVLFVPSARVWGKRHLYILGTLLMIVGGVWGGAAKSYKSLVWARIIQGFAVAPFEALINVTVSDMYFVHERGKRMALTNLALFGGSFLTPVVVGKITYTIGWRWTFYLVAIFAGLCLPLVILFVPETAFRRAAYLNTDLISEENLHPQSAVATTSSQGEDHELVGTETGSIRATSGTSHDVEKSGSLEAGTPAVLPLATFRQQLLPFNGRKTDESFFKLLLRPFPLFAHPAILWGCLIQGALIGWTVLIGVVLAAVFLGPPLFFNEVKTGYLYSGPFIGAVLGFLVSGIFADWSAKVMTKRNNGIYEPEFRIVLVLGQLVIGTAGLYGFGITANNPDKYGWFPAEFFFSCEVMGMVIGAVASALYLADAHRKFFHRFD
ncbi:MAG: hypothetical protein M1814_002410 [Vezdaea aestivalis]|nr:MAG: hypothetical protein M1814_002410 [Vezdaea aestivalis]